MELYSLKSLIQSIENKCLEWVYKTLQSEQKVVSLKKSCFNLKLMCRWVFSSLCALKVKIVLTNAQVGA